MRFSSDVYERLVAMPGLIEVPEGEHLASLAECLPAGDTIVEVGSRAGLSTCWLSHGAKAGKGAHVVAVDPWTDDPVESDPTTGDGMTTGEQVVERFLFNIDAEKLWDTLTVLRMPSLEAAKVLINPIGLVFIDALHGYWDVRGDAEAWAPKVASGGWIAFHDYYDDPPAWTHPSQVAAAINDAVLPMGCWDEIEIVGNLWTAQRS